MLVKVMSAVSVVYHWTRKEWDVEGREQFR